MLSRLATVLTVALLLACCAGVGWAQYQTQPAPLPSSSEDIPLLSPAPLPPSAPSSTPGRKPPALSGEVNVTWHRLSDFQWRYHVTNLTDRYITGVHFAVSDQDYDSRVEPAAPAGWVARRNQGEGLYRNQWLFSWFATSDGLALGPGLGMDLSLGSGSSLSYVRRTARALFSCSPADQLILPWDGDFVTVLLGAHQERRDFGSVQYPALALSPPQTRPCPLATAAARSDVQVEIYGQDKHSGDVLSMFVRSQRNLVATVQQGSLLLPSMPLFDDMIVGRSERLALIPNDVAAVRLRAFSISYGKRAPPPRLSDYEVGYRFAPAAERSNTDEYLKVLQRAERLAPSLVTPLGQDYGAIVTQWGLWRKERILEGKPLDVRDLERDLALFYVWSGPLPHSTYGILPRVLPKRIYLTPLQVRDLARQIWAQTDTLIYQTPPPEHIP